MWLSVVGASTRGLQGKSELPMSEFFLSWPLLVRERRLQKLRMLILSDKSLLLFYIQIG